MTGHGRGEQVRDGVRVVVEARTVNRKQAEIMVQLPEALSALETKVRDRVAARVSRGRCEIRVRLEQPEVSMPARVNHALARAYAMELTRLSDSLPGLCEPPGLDILVRCPGVLETVTVEGGGEQHWPILEEALDLALTGLDAMRRAEGEALAADLRMRIGLLRESVGRVRERAPQVTERYRAQLVQRLHAAGLEGVKLDDDRILKELVIFADRSDVLEELTRLESHFGQFEDCCRSTEPVGRTLDFLAQEMNREINTVGSKANDAAISVEVVRLKTELERFREQAQNIE